MIGDLSIAKLAFQQGSNSVDVQLAEARLGLEAATAAVAGKNVTTVLGETSDAALSDQPKPAAASLVVKLLDKKV